uniref:Uncharacterized protein n=1 Tax=Chlamydomonas leiostraca TaxID=1034604 RepID=A0A7S0R2F4_9CHLO|mmetsp:Transcript_12193/g.29708  ORF Transcript_12193/g.29708 Transcript_12193/m.29708 type:complete len:275 (+) Transcript_12193:1651-2475(+)
MVFDEGMVVVDPAAAPASEEVTLAGDEGDVPESGAAEGGAGPSSNSPAQEQEQGLLEVPAWGPGAGSGAVASRPKQDEFYSAALMMLAAKDRPLDEEDEEGMCWGDNEEEWAPYGDSFDSRQGSPDWVPDDVWAEKERAAAAAKAAEAGARAAAQAGAGSSGAGAGTSGPAATSPFVPNQPQQEKGTQETVAAITASPPRLAPAPAVAAMAALLVRACLVRPTLRTIRLRLSRSCDHPVAKTLRSARPSLAEATRSALQQAGKRCVAVQEEAVD